MFRNGNVALDVTRMIAQGADRLKPTDVSDDFLEFSRTSTVKNVSKTKFRARFLYWEEEELCNLRFQSKS